jgi:hypothetical protein
MNNLESFRKFHKIFEFTETPVDTESLNHLLIEIQEVLDDYDSSKSNGTLVELNKLAAKFQAAVAEAIRGTMPPSEEVSDVPKAPVFVINLGKKYPDQKGAYDRLWAKAAKRLPTFSYGGAINIFKAYANREKLMLEAEEFILEDFS